MTTNVKYAKSVNTYKVIHQQPQNDYKMSKTVTNDMKQITIKIYNICTKPPSEILRPQKPAKCPQTAHSPISYCNYTVVKQNKPLKKKKKKALQDNINVWKPMKCQVTRKKYKWTLCSDHKPLKIYIYMKISQKRETRAQKGKWLWSTQNEIKNYTITKKQTTQRTSWT